jgi:hypothetical protein
MMKKQTAVELLIKSFEERIKNGNTHHCLHDLLAQLHQAKEMEKQELEKFYNHGQWAIIDHGHGDTFEDYYNKTYSK